MKNHLLELNEIPFFSVIQNLSVPPRKNFGPSQNNQKQIDLTRSKSDYGGDHIAGSLWEVCVELLSVEQFKNPHS